MSRRPRGEAGPTSGRPWKAVTRFAAGRRIAKDLPSRSTRHGTWAATRTTASSESSSTYAEPPGDPGIVDDEAIRVDREFSGEGAVGRFETKHRVLRPAAQERVALPVRVHGQRRDRDPGHRQLDRIFPSQQAVTEDRHQIRHRRELEVAVERTVERRPVAAGRWQLDVSVRLGGDVPSTVRAAA